MEGYLNNFSREREMDRGPKIIEIRGRKIMDVGNEEGALIRESGLLFIDIKNLGFTKEFEDVKGVTSHGYMGCAEITGEFSNGERFYFHSRGPQSFKRFMEKIKSLEGGDGAAITDINIRGEFGRNASCGEDEEMYAKDEMRQYEAVCRKYAQEGCHVEIEQDSIVGLSGEKVVGYLWMEDRP